MTPPPHVPSVDSGRDAGKWRVRLLAGCALLTGLAFVQSSGYQVADTKFDLVADPLHFLSRALHLWDTGALGQLQNQAYGYLWPMGSFFLLFWGYQLPEWVIQRLWLSLVLCVAFVGGARLARAFGVRSHAAALVAGFAFAASPRILSTAGWISIESWPSAVAPWVLLPLVRGSIQGSTRRAAVLAGLGVAFVGGVNAAATFAVIPLGVVWLLTRTPGPRRRSLMFWWPVFTLMGTLWWLVPLFLLGAYSPPFLDYIESARVTTFPTTVFDALRGTSAWVPYVDETRRAGRELTTTPYVALNSGIVLMLGVIGMCLRSNPHRQFLVLGTLGGLFLVTMGHLGSVQGWFAGSLHEALDGVLAPVRNVHKFDPVVRLPLVLGLAWFVDEAVRASSAARGQKRSVPGWLQPRWTFGGLAVLGVVGASMPLVTGSLLTTERVAETPGYWQEAVRWLDENTEESAVLVAPGSEFAEYLWGEPQDEPVQYLGLDRWTIRNAIPLTPPGNIRMLDAIEARFSQGEGQEGLASYLRRAGIGYVLVRNDLKPSVEVPDPALVHQVLTRSPGIRRVRGFGPDMGGDGSLTSPDGRLLPNGGWDFERPAVDVYELVDQPTRAATADALPVVVGGPEDLLDLTTARLLGDEPTQLAVGSDETAIGPGTRLLLTDGMHERERNFGRIHDAVSPVLTPGDRRRSLNPAEDYRLEEGRRWLTTARLLGAGAVSASSSWSDPNSVGGARRSRLPYAAVDGSEETEWIVGDSTGSPWWQLELEEPQVLGDLTVRLGRDGSDRATVRVVTDQGSSEARDLRAGQVGSFDLGDEPVSRVRVEDAGTLGRLALAEVSYEGLEVARPLVTPPLPNGAPSPEAVLLRTVSDARTGCAVVEERVPCRESRVVGAEEPQGLDRIVPLPSQEVYTSSVTARPRMGPELLDLVQRDQVVRAEASSTGPADARASALAAVDGDAGTSWTPSLEDEEPELTLRFPDERRIDGIRLVVDDEAPVRRPTELTLEWDGGSRDVELDEQGRADFRPLTADRITLRPTEGENASSVTSTGAPESLPLGVGEVELRGLDLPTLSLSRREQGYGCGSGPTVEVNGESHETELVASPAALYAMEVVGTRPCGDGSVSLRPGENRVRTIPTGALVAETVALRDPAAEPPAATGARVRPAATQESRVTSRISPTGDDDVVLLRQNANPGWVARQTGETLTPVTVDGWQQGWRTAGSGLDPVFAEFEPDRAYQTGVVFGLALFVLMAFLAFQSRWWSSGRDAPPAGPRTYGRTTLVVLGVVALGTLGGWAGVLAGSAACLLLVPLRRLGDDVAPWLCGAAVWVAAGAYFLRPWGSSDGWAGDLAWPHLLVLAALAGVLLLSRDPGPRPAARVRSVPTRR